jgi:hypothetical protein
VTGEVRPPGARHDRLVIANGEDAVIELEAQFPTLQHDAVLVAENGQQYLTG